VVEALEPVVLVPGAVLGYELELELVSNLELSRGQEWQGKR
jgi:hypothetical protein